MSKIIELQIQEIFEIFKKDESKTVIVSYWDCD